MRRGTRRTGRSQFLGGRVVVDSDAKVPRPGRTPRPIFRHHHVLLRPVQVRSLDSNNFNCNYYSYCNIRINVSPVEHEKPKKITPDTSDDVEIRVIFEKKKFFFYR